MITITNIADADAAESVPVRLRLRFSRSFSIRVTLIDPFDSETTLRSKCRDVSLNRVEDSFAVITLPERGHESFALYLTDESVRQITFKMTADLREILAVLDRNH